MYMREALIGLTALGQLLIYETCHEKNVIGHMWTVKLPVNLYVLTAILTRRYVVLYKHIYAFIYLNRSIEIL